jgi:hypothetical protein
MYIQAKKPPTAARCQNTQTPPQARKKDTMNPNTEDGYFQEPKEKKEKAKLGISLT